MRGHPRWNFPAFDRCEEAIRDLFEGPIYSPAEMDRALYGPSFEFAQELPDGFIQDAMSRDLDVIINHVKHLVLLPGFEDSHGAQIELVVAQTVGHEVWTFEEDTGHVLPLEVSVSAEAEWDDDDEEPWLGSSHAWEQEYIANHMNSLHREAVGMGPTQPNAAFESYKNEERPDRVQEWIDAHREGDAYDRGETRMTDPDTGGQKGQKLARFDLIPAGPLEEIARHYGVGAAKYDDRNWEKGYSWSLSYAALNRHLNAFWQGEDFDPETGSHHLAAVAFHVLALMEFNRTHPEKDDRP